MWKSWSLFLALPLIAAGAAPSFYGAAFTSGGAATLYSVSSTGTATAIGPIGFNQVGAMDVSASGTLYGIGLSGGTSALITISTTTGAGTLVAPVTGGGWVTGGAAQDIAFRPSDGTLFAYQFGNIYTINTTTGAATRLGADGVGFPDGNGIAFSGSTLYYAGSNTPFTLNQSTGAATSVASLGFAPAFGTTNPRSPAMKFDPATNTLWAIVISGRAGAQTSLGTINTTTAAVTFVGGTQTGIDAFALAVPASSTTSSVPTLSSPMLAGLAVLMAGIGSLLARPAEARQ
ncbi:MAG: hypothetical protein M3O20_17890 [Acidobacteriota bacterium]|nr:hypothetical protein [Acidobacteriota bacterium]